VIDPIVWDRAERVLRRPSSIAREVKRRWKEGSLIHDLAAAERMIVSVTDKQGRIAKRVADIDGDVATPLMAALHALAANRKAAERERDDLQRRLADEDEDAARLRSLDEWCQTVAANLDALTYDEKRRALDGLGVTVEIWRPGATNEQGEPYPRRQIALDPMLPLSSGSRPASGTSCAPLPARRRRGSACGDARSPG
jgi:hypothetical protein